MSIQAFPVRLTSEWIISDLAGYSEIQVMASQLQGIEMKKQASKPQNVDDYLSDLPKDVRGTLEKLRKTIKAAAPKATEGISYQMPMYKQDGMLVGFAAFKNHCSLFPGSTPLEQFKDELKSYKTSKGTIQFTVDKPLPSALVKKLVKSCIAQNKARVSKKTKK